MRPQLSVPNPSYESVMDIAGMANPLTSVRAKIEQTQHQMKELDLDIKEYEWEAYRWSDHSPHHITTDHSVTTSPFHRARRVVLSHARA